MQNRQPSSWWYWALPLLAFLALFLWGLLLPYPFLGHDYFYFWPRLLSGQWHVAQSGWSPFRFSPHFCGGLPVYGNPHDVFYSLLQLLSFVMDLWSGTVLLTLATLAVGYAGWTLLGRDVLRLPPPYRHLLSLLVLSNGYYFMHAIVGHLQYLSLPLAGWMLWLLFRRDPGVWAHVRSAAWFALLGAFMLYSGGFFNLVLILTGILILLPWELGRRTAEERHALLLRLSACGVASAALWASKVVGVYSFMRFFPRFAEFTQLPDGVGVLPFLAQVLWGIPQHPTAFAEAAVGVHDYSAFTSPLAAIGLLCGIWFWGRDAWRRRTLSPRTVAGVLYACAVALLLAQIIAGRGFLVPFVKQLPLLASWRVATRFIIVPATAITLLGTWGIWRTLNGRVSERWEWRLCAAGGCVSLLLAAWAYAPLIDPQTLRLTLPYDQLQASLRAAPAFTTQPVTAVTANTRVSDFQPVLTGTTNVTCYEHVFGHHNEYLVTQVHEGPVEPADGGTFNLTNPVCLQYPTENDCQPGDRFRADQVEVLRAYVRGGPVAWKLSTVQRWSDGIALLALIACLLLVSGSLVQWARSRLLSARG